MVRVSVQVRNGTVRFGVTVQAESIERALEVVGKQNPSERCEVTFPIDPDTFFVKDSAATLRQPVAG